ncbi:MAG: hypothetical protein ACKVIN_04640, partial [Longimicrobiales bacterium]
MMRLVHTALGHALVGRPAARALALAALALAAITTTARAQQPFMPVSVDQESGRVLLTLPTLGQDVLYLNALATGLGSTRVFGRDGGGGGDEAVVRFERHG